MDRTAFLGVTLVALFVAPVVSGSMLPPPLDDPVVNGEFELFLPSQIPEALQGTPADECIGIGHQVLYGSDTWQARVEDAAMAAADGDNDGAMENATEAAERWVSDPVDEGIFFAGYGHCIYSTGGGYDVVWLNPVSAMTMPVVHWSHQDTNTQFGDFTDSGEREARIGANKSASSHNMWQASLSPHQAYSGNFDALEFRVEGGTFDNLTSGSVAISLSATPLEDQHPLVLLFIDCELRFTLNQIKGSATLIEGTQDYQVSVDPTTATFTSKASACNEAKQEWDAGDEDDRREILGRLRMVQFSFWNFNRGAGDVLIDGVSLPGTSTFLEEAANGNINL